MKGISPWSGRSAFHSLILGRSAGLQVAILAIGIGLPVLAVIPLHLQQQLVDVAIPARETRQIVLIAAQYLGVVLAAGLLKFLVQWLRGWVQEIVNRVLRVAIVEAQRHRSGAEAKAALGTVTSIIAGEVEDLGGFAAEALNTPLIEGGTLITLMGYLVYSDLRLAAIGMGALLLQAVVTPLMQNRVNRLTRMRITALRRIGLDLIAAKGSQGHDHTITALHDIRRIYRLRLRMNAIKALTKVLNNLVLNLATIVILTYGGWMVIQGQVSLGVVVALVGGLAQIGDHWGELWTITAVTPMRG